MKKQSAEKGSNNLCCVHFNVSCGFIHLIEVKCDTKVWSFLLVDFFVREGCRGNYAAPQLNILQTKALSYNL